MTRNPIRVPFLVASLGLAVTGLSAKAHAVSSAELYTTKSYPYGRIEARIHFAKGDGIVSSLFLWKENSEKAGEFWNELDFEKLGADCHLESNAFYGNPEAVHSKKHALDIDLCGGFHNYTYEWTPEYIAWFVDGNEIRRETGATAAAYAENAAAGMQIRFNIWPGTAAFGGNFDPAIMPVYQYVNWVEYSEYADGVFTPKWREDFTASTLPSGWATGNWDSPKAQSTHSRKNVNFIDGFAVLSVTADDALGAANAAPSDTEVPPVTQPGTGGAGGATNTWSATGTSAGATAIIATGGATAFATTDATTNTAPVVSSGGGNGLVPTTTSTSDDGGCSLASSPSKRSGFATLLGGLLAAALMRRQRRDLNSKASEN
jgi:hypothetical protein